MGRPCLLAVNVGDVFGDLKCIGIFYNAKKKQNVYKMKCVKCGRTKDMISSTIRLNKGITHSACGQYIKTVNKVFYNRWQAMRTRTNNPNYEHYKDYGERGINSNEFENFIDFFDSMYISFIETANIIGENNTSLDRINPDGNYTSENCRWIYKNDQQKNQRKTKRFIATFPDGHEEYSESVTSFKEKYSLDDQSIYDCLNGKFSQHKGYRFREVCKSNDKNLKISFCD